jgi:hypothetical protein
MYEPSASKPKRRQRLPSTGGSNVTPLKPTPAYRTRKAALTDDQVRLSLELVEEGIAVDPFHRDGRQEIGDLVYDRTERGIVVVFSMVDGEAVLVMFRDLFDS